MNTNVLYILHFFSYGVSIVSIVIALLILFRYKQIDKNMKSISQYLVISAIIEVISFVVGKCFHQNNLIFFHIFAPVEFFLLSQFFFGFYKKNDVKLPFSIIKIAFLSLLLINSFFIQPWNTYNSYGLTAVSIAVILMSLFAFYLMLEKDLKMPFLFEIKWLMISFFLLHCSSLIVVFFSNKILVLEHTQQLTVWRVRAFFMLITKLLQLYLINRLIKNNE